MLKVDWIFQEVKIGKKQGYGSLVGTLARAPNDSLFGTDLVITLVLQFWDRYSSKVKRYILLPFLIYFMSTIYYFSKNLIDPEFRASDKSFSEQFGTVEYFNRTITILGLLYFGAFEMIQFYRDGMGYFNDIWNYFDIASVVLNSFLLIDLLMNLDVLS